MRTLSDDFHGRGSIWPVWCLPFCPSLTPDPSLPFPCWRGRKIGVRVFWVWEIEQTCFLPPLPLHPHTHPTRICCFWRNLGTMYLWGRAVWWPPACTQTDRLQLSGALLKFPKIVLLSARVRGRERGGPAPWETTGGSLMVGGDCHLGGDSGLRGGDWGLISLRGLEPGDASGGLKTLFPGSTFVLVPLPSYPVQIAELKHCLTKFKQAGRFGFETFKT